MPEIPNLAAPINSESRSTTEFLANQEKPGELLEFDLGERQRPDWDTYNPSIPFKENGRLVQLLRYENKDNEAECEVVFVDPETQQLIAEAPVFSNAQDPYYLGKFEDSQGLSWHVIGMVKIGTNARGEISTYRDTYYKYRNSITELSRGGSEPEPFFVGPDGQKDLRFAQLKDKIAVFPRPQLGETFGNKGMIGYFETDNLDSIQTDLKKYFTNQDPRTLIDGIFSESEWGGVNQLLPQPDGQILIISHRAKFVNEQEQRDYESICFLFDPERKIAGPVSVIATADDFEYVKPKKDSLRKVVFTSGIVPIGGDTDDYWLYAGVGDRKVGRRRIPNPAKSVD